MFTKYMFNRLGYNPAAAGSNGHLAFSLLHRQQWLGFEGAPVSQAFNAHTPLRNERAAVGMSASNDQAGGIGSTQVAFAYAYHLPIGTAWTLAMGVQAGLLNWRANWADVVLEKPNDEAFKDVVNRWAPVFGTGLELSHERYYLSVGIPRLTEPALRDYTGVPAVSFGQQYRHLYLTAGAAFPLGSDQLVFRPLLLLKTGGLASRNANSQSVQTPTQADIDLSLFLYKTFWIGAALRTGLQENTGVESADVWVSWYARNGLRLGAAYDLGLGNLQRLTSGSVELMAGYEFDIKKKRVATPRYF